jgi:hypothetical protein
MPIEGKEPVTGSVSVSKPSGKKKIDHMGYQGRWSAKSVSLSNGDHDGLSQWLMNVSMNTAAPQKTIQIWPQKRSALRKAKLVKFSTAIRELEGAGTALQVIIPTA